MSRKKQNGAGNKSESSRLIRKNPGPHRFYQPTCKTFLIITRSAPSDLGEFRGIKQTADDIPRLHHRSDGG